MRATWCETRLFSHPRNSASSPVRSLRSGASRRVNTPNGLNTSNPNVQRALADAVTDLTSNGIPLDATLRDYQYEMRGGEKIPIHGGPGTLGDFNAINVTWTPPKGYPDVQHGSSFVMAASLGKGCPKARTILTYSQSANPDSPYFADQTRMFSNKQWVLDRFCAKQIKRDPKLRVQRLNGGVKQRRRHHGH